LLLLGIGGAVASATTGACAATPHLPPTGSRSRRAGTTGTGSRDDRGWRRCFRCGGRGRSRGGGLLRSTGAGGSLAAGIEHTGGAHERQSRRDGLERQVRLHV